MNRIYKSTAWAALACIAAALATGGAARADMASPKLAQYEKPVDDAIGKALEYLVANQQEDGSFVKGSKGDGQTGITSLCVMAFLSKGYTPGTGKYGEVINKGVDYILDHQSKNGLLVDTKQSKGEMYNHGIATLMLSEVSGMVDPERQKKIDEALPKALKLILSAQQVKKSHEHEGGWRYKSNSNDSDISVTGWQIMALRSARANGANVPKETIEQALEYILKCRDSSGGFSYMPKRRQPGIGRTGTALLSLSLAGRQEDKEAIAAGDWILHDISKGGKGRGIKDSHLFYATYYASQGMFQLGGNYWEQWADVMYTTLLQTQRKDGSWPSRHGEAYATSMAVLAMAVVYRQLPIYQR